MKIEIEIPDKYDERTFYVFAGIEPVARKIHNKNEWELKTGECSRCGKCCRNLSQRWPFADENGRCKFLGMSGPEHYCTLVYARPWSCAVDHGKTIKECTVKWVEHITQV